MSDAVIGPDLNHPDAIIRLVSTILRFRCPEVGEQGKTLSYVAAFKTVGTHDRTQSVLKQADAARNFMIKSLTPIGNVLPHKTIVQSSQKYIPLIHQLLLTCKVQPENARLDAKLVFEWSSGIEKKSTFFKSEALMFELVMSIATEAMAYAGQACDSCAAGDFSSASREFKQAASIMKFLAEDQLPKWIAKGTPSVAADSQLPMESTVGTCEAFKVLFLAISQQMAVATVLIKPGTPNYSLVSKLSLGIAEQMDFFVGIMRSKAAPQKDKMDPSFFSLMTFQISLQRGLSMYFMARHTWESKESFGNAIAMLREAIFMLRTREAPNGVGLPEITKKSPLLAISNDVMAMRTHMAVVLRSWEKDNSSVYFDSVPRAVPEAKRLTSGLHMIKPDVYKLEHVEPVPLILPGSNAPSAPMMPNNTMSDEEMARMLQARLNAGDNW